jgi:hypothetical protein
MQATWQAATRTKALQILRRPNRENSFTVTAGSILNVQVHVLVCEEGKTRGRRGNKKAEWRKRSGREEAEIKKS